MPKKLAKILMAVSMGVMFLPLVSFAQMNINTGYALSNELGVETVPNYPKPNEMVTISLSLYTGDLNSADISWYQNGKIVLVGKGETRYSFKTGPAGAETRIAIKVKLLGGLSFFKNLIFNPASIDMVWEANSYVPPFYKGKALYPKQGVLKIVALPEFINDGKRIPAGNLVYQWSNIVESYQSQSGYGKNVLILNGSILGKSEYIRVTVTDPISNLTAQGSISVNPVNPEIVFYENNPYYGYIFDSAVNSAFNLSGEEIQVLATPYYFTKEKDGLITYEWKLNNQSVPSLSGSRTAIFKKPEGEAGKSFVSLRMENTNKILQQADNSLTINFENK
jgi:hypothetical protein